MKVRHLEFSVVVAANDHNPTILNPDFLDRQDIVPTAWGWKVAGNPITTPPFAVVSYDSGVTVSVEANRLQVRDVRGTSESSKVLDIARKYVEILRHVRYSAVGINFRSLAEHAEPNAFLKERFLKSGPWDGDAHVLQGIGLKFVYLLDETRVTLTTESLIGTESSEGQSKESSGILVYANFHSDCHGYPAADQAIAHLSNTEKNWAAYQNLLSDLLKI